MSIKAVDRSRDEEIIGIIRSILSQGTMNVETINESLLVKLMELRGTPIQNIDKIYRDIESDYQQWLSEARKE